MSSPLRITFDVACPPSHAFSVWTARIADWWPPDHTVTGAPGLRVVMESRVGTVADRCADGPVPTTGVVVGSYRMGD